MFRQICGHFVDYIRRERPQPRGLMALPWSPYVLASWTSFLTLDLCVDILGHRVKQTGTCMCTFSFFSLSFFVLSDCWRVCSFTVCLLFTVCCILSIVCIRVYIVLLQYYIKIYIKKQNKRMITFQQCGSPKKNLNCPFLVFFRPEYWQMLNSATKPLREREGTKQVIIVA